MSCSVFFISFFLQNIPCKSLAQRQKQDQSLSQQREFIGVTGNKIAEDKKSTRQLVLFHNKAACMFHNKALSAHKSDYCIACSFYMSTSDMTEFEKNNL